MQHEMQHDKGNLFDTMTPIFWEYDPNLLGIQKNDIVSP